MKRFNQLVGGSATERNYLKNSVVFSMLACLVVLSMMPIMARELPDVRAKIKFDSREDLNRLRRLRIDADYQQNGWLVAELTRTEVKTVRKEGFIVEIMEPDLAAERAMYKARGENRAYHNYESLRTEMMALETAHPTLAQFIVTGQSVQGRDIMTLKISDNVTQDENEPEVRWEGNIHGDEKIALEVTIYLVNELLSNYGTDPQITDIVDNTEIFFTPSVNPDGMMMAQRYNANGVDCNRDYGYMWDSSGDSPSPWSQPETQAIMEIMLDNQFVMGMSGHSGTELFIYSWCYTYDQSWDHDEHDSMYNAYSALSGYTGGQCSHALYTVNGGSLDCDYGMLGAMGVCVEISYDKTPPASEIMNYCLRNRDAALDMFERAGNGIQGVVTDSQTGEPIPAIVEVVENGWPVYCDPVMGDYHRYILPGTYTLQVWANDYEPVVIHDVTVPADGAVTVDVTLDRGVDSYAYKFIYCRDNQEDSNNHTQTASALGPVDGEFYSICVAGYLCVDMGESTPIVDSVGSDFTIWEGDDGSDEGYSVAVSNSWQGPWQSVGTGTGTASFDLAGTGLETARFVKIIDDGSGAVGAYFPGFDLDAISTVHIVPGCGEMELDRSRYACEDSVAIELIDADINLDPGAVDTVTILVQSDSDPSGESVLLTETGMDTSEFVGTVDVHEGSGGTGHVGVANGDTLTVTYQDSDCEGEPQTVIQTGLIDCESPVITNITVQDVSHEGAVISWTTDEAASSTVMIGTTTPPGNEYTGDNAVLLHEIFVDELDQCTEYFYSVKSIDTVGNVTIDDNNGNYYSFTTFQLMVLFQADMNVDPGWSYDGQWAWGVPTGTSGDPDSGYTGDNVVGYNLTGDYTNGLSQTTATTGPIDCSSASQVYLSFWRWLGVESSAYDHASIELSDDGGGTWDVIWDHTGGTLEDGEWIYQEFDLTQWAANTSNVKIRWNMGPTDSSETYCGWNIDDVLISYTSPCNVPFMEYSSHSIDDSSGNNDGQINAGEAISLGMTLHNIGTDAENLSAQLFTLNPHISISSDTVQFPDIPQSGTGEATTDFLFDVSPDAEDGELIPFTISWVCDGNSGVASFTDHVVAPNLNIESIAILDTSGDGDGILDPGETAQIRVVLTNSGNGLAQNISAILSSDQSSYVAIDDNSAMFPDINGGGMGTSLNPHFTVSLDPGIPDPTAITFTLDISAQGYIAQDTFISQATSSTFSLRYQWNMDTDPGWTAEGNWAWGVPQGNDDDPSSGFTGSNVYGYNLSGEYTNGMSEMNLTSLPINCESFANVEVRFMRWLGVESSSYDHASFRVSNDNTTWTTIWDHSGSTFTDPDWQALTYDISQYADGQPTVWLRWVMGTTDSSVTYCGWNIDDVEIWAESTGPIPTNTPVPPTEPPTIVPTNTPSTPTSTPTPFICLNNGDCDMNGNLTPEDALFAFQVYLGIVPDPAEDESCRADCSGNEAVTPEDALCIFLHYISGSCDCMDLLNPVDRSQPPDVREFPAAEGSLVFETMQMNKTGQFAITVHLGDHQNAFDAFGFKINLPNGIEYLGYEAGDITADWEVFGANLDRDILTVGGFEPVYAVQPQASGSLVTILVQTASPDLLNEISLFGPVDDAKMFRALYPLN